MALDYCSLLIGQVVDWAVIVSPGPTTGHQPKLNNVKGQSDNLNGVSCIHSEVDLPTHS